MPRGCAISLLIATSIFGALLSLVAMTFIVFNESQSDLPALVCESRVLRPDDPSAPNGSLVSLTGAVELEGQGVGDDMFLAPGNYLKVERIAEMYAWERTKSHEDSQGRTVYKDRKIWTRTTSGLNYSGNPDMQFKGATFSADKAHIAGIRIEPSKADLPLLRDLPLTQELLLANTQGTIKDGVLYVGTASPNSPKIGDMRVSYRVVPNNQTMTIFGAFESGSVVGYEAPDGQIIYDILVGDRETALQAYSDIQVLTNWIMRLLIVAMLWFGLLLLSYASRRLVAWPQALGISIGSVKLATLVSVVLVALSFGSLWLSGGSLTAFWGALSIVLLMVLAAIVKLRNQRIGQFPV
jgi:hypothetical protein